MPIKLVTGVPGAGKTLSALEAAVKERDAGRTVICIGVEGLKDSSGFLTMDDPRDWQDAPDGALFVVDEVWKWWGTTADKNDERMSKLAEHRHRGFDFIFTCQAPSQLHAFVRALVGEHTHVVRKFGTTVCQRFRWGAMVDDPNSLHARKRGQEEAWRYPQAIFALYQSATMHTIKRRVPVRVLLLPLIALAAIGLVYFGVTSWIDRGKGEHSGDAGPASSLAAGAVAAQPMAVAAVTGEKAPALSYLELYTPRISGLPWTAPAYDDAAAGAPPDIACISTDKTCRCITDQGTTWQMQDVMCRHIARNGVYNPHRRAGEEKRTFAQPQQQQRARARS